MFKNINTQYFKSHVKKQGPYCLFVTMTIAKDMNSNGCCNYISTFIRKFNRMVFHRDYAQQNKFLEGVVFVENHKFGTSKNDIHFHMLVKYNPKYQNYTLGQLEDIILNAAQRASGNDNVFNPNGIDVQLVRDDGAIDYCFKDINDRNTDRIKYISKDGITGD